MSEENSEENTKSDIKSGNKLPTYYDDPVDLFYKRYIDILNPHFKKAGMTPNMITSISFFFGLLTCYLYYKSNYILAGLSYIISYFFDTMDGYFARLYGMGSVFGSYYDSVSDNIVVLIIVYMFYNKSGYIKPWIKPTIFFILLFFALGCIYQMSCQEKYTKKTQEEHVSDGLAFLNNVKCKDFENMKYTRYFGPGVCTLTVAILIMGHAFYCKK
jgi:phosphatidylglycerophosphate synthase